jgi:hypothetical protein
MLKFVVAGVWLVVVIGPSGAQTSAAPACVDCRNFTAEGQIVKEPESTRPVTSPACADCPLPLGFDSQEVIKKVRTIDHSKVLNTVTVVPAGRRGKTTRHLVIHLTEIHHVGVIQHNHTIIEKTIRTVRRPRNSKQHQRAPLKRFSWKSSYGSAEVDSAEHRKECSTVYIPNGWMWSRINRC